MQIKFVNYLPNTGHPNYIYYIKSDGKFYGWDINNLRFYNLSTPNLNDVEGIAFNNLQEGDVLSYDSASQTWINKVINTSTGVNSFNERQGDVYLLDTDVTYALGFTPEDAANKSLDINADQASDIKYPSVKSVYNWVMGLGYITSSALTGYATQTWVNSQGFITNVITALGYTPENTSNKTSTVVGNETSETYFPTIKGVVDWVIGLGYITASSLTGYATETWVTGLGYITSSALTGYATETWVSTQGFITNVVTALGYTPENASNKQTDLTASSTKYPTVDAVNTGLSTKEPTITAGTSSQYWRGDKSWQTLDKSAVGLSNVDNTSDANKPVSTAQATAIGLKEDSANKSTSTADSESSTKFPVWSAIVSYFDVSRIKTILGITTLSGSNTGDETNSTIISKIGYTPENTANKTTSVTGNETSNVLFPTVKSVVDWVTSLFIKRGTNTTSYVQKVTSTGTIGDSSIYDNGTFVGIGKTSDGANGKLQISGNLALTNSAPILNLVSSPGSGGRIYWNDGSNRFALAYQAFQGGEPTGSLNLYSYSASKTVLSVTNGGQLLVGVAYPINTNYAVSAQLEVASTTKGFLQPRMTTTQRNAIATPATGLSIYNTTTNTEDYYNGTSWVSLQTTTAATKSYGAFQDDTIQNATDDSIGYGVRFNTNDISGHGVEIVPDSFSNNTLIKFDNAGTYNIQFSLQFQNIDFQFNDVSIWLRKNGEDPSSDIVGTTRFISVPNSNGAINGHTIAAYNYFVDANSNDYYQIVWSTTNHANITMESYPFGSPQPSGASAILTVNQIN